MGGECQPRMYVGPGTRRKAHRIIYTLRHGGGLSISTKGRAGTAQWHPLLQQNYEQKVGRNEAPAQMEGSCMET